MITQTPEELKSEDGDEITKAPDEENLNIKHIPAEETDNKLPVEESETKLPAVESSAKLSGEENITKLPGEESSKNEEPEKPKIPKSTLYGNGTFDSIKTKRMEPKPMTRTTPLTVVAEKKEEPPIAEFSKMPDKAPEEINKPEEVSKPEETPAAVAKPEAVARPEDKAPETIVESKKFEGIDDEEDFYGKPVEKKKGSGIWKLILLLILLLGLFGVLIMVYFIAQGWNPPIDDKWLKMVGL